MRVIMIWHHCARLCRHLNLISEKESRRAEGSEAELPARLSYPQRRQVMQMQLFICFHAKLVNGSKWSDGSRVEWRVLHYLAMLTQLHSAGRHSIHRVYVNININYEVVQSLFYWQYFPYFAHLAQGKCTLERALLFFKVTII